MDLQIEPGGRGSKASTHGGSLTVEVVVPTWQRAQWLQRCLKALVAQQRCPDRIIVVGRAGDDAGHGVVERLTGLPVRWVEVDRSGHIAPVRRGLQEARGEIVAFLDDDAEPQEGWLDALVQSFTDPSIACVGGRVITPGFRGRVHLDAGRVRWYGKYVGNIGALDAPGPVDVDGVMEGNWAWRVDVLRSLEFDPRLDFDDASMYGLDLCLQAKTKGHRVVYQPLACVNHHVAPRRHELDRNDRPARTLAYARNYTYLSLKHQRGFRRWVFLGWWWLIGDRGAYGLAAGLADSVLRRDGIGDLIRASLVGKWKGARLWKSTR